MAVFRMHGKNVKQEIVRLGLGCARDTAWRIGDWQGEERHVKEARARIYEDKCEID
jgi:hypothetical protein